MDIQKEREAFEHHKAKQLKIDYVSLKDVLDDCERRFPNNRYAGYSDFNRDFETWLAAKAQAVPEGFVLMPKEPTKEIVEAFWNSWLVEQPNAQTMFFAYKAMIEAQESAND